MLAIIIGQPKLERPARACLAVTLILVCLAAGCASQYYEAYQRKHPAWDPALFPAMGSELEAVLAGLHRPSRHTFQVAPQRVKIFDVTREAWEKVSLAEAGRRRKMTASVTSHLVVGRIVCSTRHSYNNADAWYLVVQDELVAYRHAGFDRGCDGASVEARMNWIPAGFAACLNRFIPRTIETALDLVEDNCGAAPIHGAIGI